MAIRQFFLTSLFSAAASLACTRVLAASLSEQLQAEGPAALAAAACTQGDALTEHLVESLLEPSKSIRPEYRAVTILTTEGQSVSGLVALPMPDLPTGIMRGRFSPRDQAPYICGLFAWAVNKTAPGGFFRVRRTSAAVEMPIDVAAAVDGTLHACGSAPD